ncbi:MAG: ATP-binding protein [Candidatus Babeliaceae bacterium]|jgi:SpoVK/Ycf46/Vps4 family AAA+-type ATPase
MCKFINSFLISLMVLSIYAEEKSNNIDKQLDRLDHILSKIPDDKIFEILSAYETSIRDARILEEKRKLVDAILLASGESIENDTDNKDAQFFVPKEPGALSDEDRELPIQERISKRYIGDIPKQVEDLIFYFSNHDECLQNNIKIYNRLLLHGKPGTGKSHLFKILAHALQLPYLSFSASFFADKYIGESSRRIRRAFEAAKKLDRPVLIFIDEIDAIAIKRTDNMHNEHRAVLITLLTELQDLQDNKNIFVIAATNDMKALDPAIKDRFAGSVCEIKDLTVAQRAQLFKKVFADNGVEIDEKLAHRLAYVTKVRNRFETDESLSETKSRGFSNRDIEYIVATALLKRFSDNKKNPDNPKHICAYIRQAIDATGKKGLFSTRWFQSYSDGI